jgi:mRNA interferase MazF
MICDAWTVAVAPFPFVDSPQAKPRPCLVLSLAAFNEANGHSLAAMITRPLATQWPSDTPIENIQAAGLPAPSVVRWKLFTLPNELLKRRAGNLATSDMRQCQMALRRLLPALA